MWKNPIFQEKKKMSKTLFFRREKKMSKNPIFQERKKMWKNPIFQERKKISKTPIKKKFFTAKFIVKKFEKFLVVKNREKIFGREKKIFGHFLVLKKKVYISKIFSPEILSILKMCTKKISSPEILSIFFFGPSVTLRKKKSQKTLFFRRDKKNVTLRKKFVHFENFFFSPPEILSILHAWLYGKNLVIFLEKFMIFCKWTKKFFFNVNPYHFWNSCVTLRKQKNNFLKGYLPTSCVFFSQKKKKKFFFFRAPKFLKNPAKNKKWLKIFLHQKVTLKWSSNFYIKSDCKNFFRPKVTVKNF